MTTTMRVMKKAHNATIPSTLRKRQRFRARMSAYDKATNQRVDGYYSCLIALLFRAARGLVSL